MNMTISLLWEAIQPPLDHKSLRRRKKVQTFFGSLRPTATILAHDAKRAAEATLSPSGSSNQRKMITFHGDDDGGATTTSDANGDDDDACRGPTTTGGAG
ncbi:hypothetical protein NKH28_32865 [Mesorhizobium sp. M1227]|uniref:hypothetical protein n=1 Tax=Mesorhizobium sp. M1227 TaxID=2957071 RepID=UPI003335CFC6